MLAKRIVNTEPLSMESNLFINIIPNLIHLLSKHNDKKDITKELVRDQYNSQQISLLAMECMVNTLRLDAKDNKVIRELSYHLHASYMQCFLPNIDTSCTFEYKVSTLFTKPSPYSLFLQLMNSWVYISLSHIYSFQYHVLLAFIPQFIVPHLDVILSSQELSSPIMRHDNFEDNNVVKEILIRFNTLVTLSPVR